nr:MAG TPA: hypothetical protein [Bacteriophage sp.]
MKPLHTSMKPLHCFLAAATEQGNFAPATTCMQALKTPAMCNHKLYHI